MKVGDLVNVSIGSEYREQRLGIVISILQWQGVREIKVRFPDGTTKNCSPWLVEKINESR